MNWYLAKIVYRILCGEGEHTAQFDEQLRLVSAAMKKKLLPKRNLLVAMKKIVF